ncbi:MAG: cobalt-precorrin-6A reductase [Alphaproteobacteria bacterium]|nr:cobalt-precorrin-6A reductase [Alphaproteobacteria bacterium]
MTQSLLILGGTTEATELCHQVHARGIDATVSLAGRVARPRRQPVPRRIGGFGGVEGLVRYLRAHRITQVIDATHPFAVQMSRNSIAACAEAGVPLVALCRPAWAPQQGDTWHRVPDIAGAVGALAGPPRRVMLAVGRMHLAEFAPNPQHFYLLRLVDPPGQPVPFADHHIVVSRGPFNEAGDRALMDKHGIDAVVSKNSGGQGAYAKIGAARTLHLPVIMIERPEIGARAEVADVQGVLSWLDHAGTDLGV